MAAAELTLDLWTFDVGVNAGTPEACMEEAVRRVEESWDSGADIVLLPEFTWMSLEPLLAEATQAATSPLQAVAHTFWLDLFPTLRQRLTRPGKAVVLGTAPYHDALEGCLYNRAPIFANGRAFHQDKLHLTPWENAFRPGHTLHIWEFSGLRIVVIICLDIEIPELAARLRGENVDLILCPSATETILGVERVNRCASARAVELGCYVGVAHLVGQTQSELIDQNIGRVALYRPSQAAFRDEPRCTEGEIVESGFQRLRVTLSSHALKAMRRLRVETNPALLGRESAGLEHPILIQHDRQDL
jgi:predicted amidohydrolase